MNFKDLQGQETSPSTETKDKRILPFVTQYQPSVPNLACVASVSSRGSSRKLGQEQKKKMNQPFFASALTFAQELDWKRLLRTLCLT